MIPYLGDFAEDATVYIYFNTFSSNDPSASVTVTTLVDADIKVHKDGAIAEIVTDGATVTIDFDSRTGVHKIEIDTSAHADYSIGSDYMVMIEGATVDAGNITAAVATFSIENRFVRVDEIAANAITATAINADAITAAKIADNAFSNEHFAAGALTSAEITSSAGAAVTSLGSNVITAASIAASAMDGKGDWNIGKTGYSLTAGTGLGNQTSNITGTITTATNVTNGVTLANGALTDASLGGNMEIVFETDFATNYNQTRNGWVTNVQDTIGTGNLPADAVTISGDATTADNLQILFDGNEGFYSAYSGPRGPGVYLNDAAANTNTTNGTDGTIGNPVSTIGAAKTLADSMSLDRVYLINDTAITLAATMEDYEFVGIGSPTSNSIALNSIDVDQSSFHNLTISGIQGGSLAAKFEDCIIGTSTIHCHAIRCGFNDSVTGTTFSNNDDILLDSCFSMVAGNATPIFICSGANLDASFRHFSGGIEIKTSSATATISIETDGQVIFNADCNTSTVVSLRGNLTITDNTGGMSALTTGAVYDKRSDIAAVKTVTDQMVFTKANELDVNTQSINGAAVVGDGNATPWDGA